ncbi:hypothetical protein D3C73_1243740 [compost metagenome]
MHHRQHGALGFYRVGVLDHLHHRHRDDLPGHAEFVLEPAALLCLDRPAGGQASPEVVDFFLGLAVDLERDRFVEDEVRATVKTRERLPIEFETDRHDRTDFPAVELLPGLAVVSDGGDFRVIEDRTVKLCGLFGLTIEPEARCEFLHM